AMLAAKQNERAGELALACKEKMASLTENQEQLKNAEELYKNLTRQRDTFFKEAQKRLDTIKNKISRAQMAEAQAKMAEIASAMTFDMNGSGANLERLEKGLDDRIADAQGKSRVAADSLKSGGFVQLEAEQKALEAQALAEFATSMGITPPATETPLAEETPESKKELA
ncbi:MAG: hypothetical protein Q8L24_00960, partial [bacterium]|nr:hypothetical protein [bacterium]